MSVEQIIFTDVIAALEEAEFLANQTGWPHSIVVQGKKMAVMTRHRAYRRIILETIHPTR